MQVTGTITAINTGNGLFIVDVSQPGYGFVVYELLDEFKIGLGDTVVCDPYALGSTKIHHIPQGQIINVVGQSGPSSLKVARRQIGIREA